MPELPLINKYRPDTFETFVGNTGQIDALRRALLVDSRPHAFLFTGPSGIGKTTAARIIATTLNADVLEIDAASNNGVDAMRSLTETAQYMPMNGSGRRLIILDEAHMLSKASWNAALKLIEEPPSHLFLALCTTEAHKVPDTIKTRCYHVNLLPLKPQEIEDLVVAVAELEGWTVENDVIAAVVQHATGQPRKALSALQAVHDCTSRAEVQRVLPLLDDSEPIIEICQILLQGDSPTAWPRINAALERIEDTDFEEGIVLAGRYIASAMQRSKKPAEAERAHRLLAALTFPNATYDKKIAFLAAVGRALWES